MNVPLVNKLYLWWLNVLYQSLNYATDRKGVVFADVNPVSVKRMDTHGVYVDKQKQHCTILANG